MRFPPSPRALFALGALAPIGLVGFAVALTLGYGVAACPLCVVQRMLFLAIAFVGLIGLMVSTPLASVGAATSMLALAATGGAIAGYQIYLEHHPFAATCGDGTSLWERAVEAAGNAIPAIFRADGLCGSSTWSMFGVSIVEWSLIGFCGLFLLALLALYSSCRNDKGRT